MTIELIYDRDCPNVERSRANLGKALAAFPGETQWTEWDRGAPESPSHVRRYGSPTILVDGNDVAGGPASEAGPSCRLYRNSANRFDGAPSVEQIAMALIWKASHMGDSSACPACASDLQSDISSTSRNEILAAKRKIEVFSAGCPACEETITLVNRIACPSCEVSMLDMKQASAANRARKLGIRSVPAVVIDGRLADCCRGRGPEEAALRAAGIG
ncbi:MAG: thioredoxin family protein [Terriglobia bacterium]